MRGHEKQRQEPEEFVDGLATTDPRLRRPGGLVLLRRCSGIPLVECSFMIDLEIDQQVRAESGLQAQDRGVIFACPFLKCHLHGESYSWSLGVRSKKMSRRHSGDRKSVV